MAGSLISVELYNTPAEDIATGNKQKRGNGAGLEGQQLVVRLPVSLFKLFTFYCC